MQTPQGFTIFLVGAYLHDSGSKGRFIYDAAQALLTFQGGSLDKQTALVGVKETTGYVRLYNERRSRPVVGPAATVSVLREFLEREGGQRCWPVETHISEGAYYRTPPESVTRIMRMGLADHLHCAALRKFRKPPTAEELPAPFRPAIA